jgi:hypothetical protein
LDESDHRKMNKKIDRLRQWAGERIGAETKTVVSDDFKALEDQTSRRYDGKKGAKIVDPLEESCRACY